MMTCVRNSLEVLPEHVHRVQEVGRLQRDEPSLLLILDMIGAPCVNPDEDELFVTALARLGSLLLGQMFALDLFQDRICSDDKFVVKVE